MREVVDQHLTSQAALTLGLASDSFSGGGASSSRPAGVFACERSAVEDVKSIGYADVKETLIPRLRERGKNVVSVPIGIDSVRVRDFDSYLAANEILLHQLLNDRVALPMHERRADSLIHRSARVSERSKLIGPVWIGPNAEISAGATLIGPVCVGRGAKIGTGSAVASSVLWDDSIVAEACHVDACVLSCGAQVSAGESTYHALKTHVGMGSLARGLRSATPAARSRTWSPNSGVES
ncbi:MAG: NDP-sugar synthase [Phycisphaerales bacterium]|nr:NDP-sugar synthase [Phycisphaerales bacterium]